MQFFFLIIVYAQSLTLQPVKGSPTKEVYDLFYDSKGYLWLGHELGISRYDGRKFTNFSSPDQSSLGITDIFEDRFGRIWCHNFSNQIFYIQNESMHLLKGYDAAKETVFPRITILGDELVSTSVRGLFICDLKTLKGYYLACKNLMNVNDSTISLTKSRNSIIAKSNRNWYSYANGKVSHLHFRGNPDLDEFELAGLQNLTITNDTIYATSRHKKGKYYKLLVGSKSISIVKQERVTSVLNTISYDEPNVWINEKKISYTLDKRLTINGHDLSDIITDKFGNIWCSSLTEGLLKNSTGAVMIKKLKPSLKNDFITCLIKYNELYIAGTQKGEILVADTSMNIISKYNLNYEDGEVQKIFTYPGGLLVKPAAGLYHLNIIKRKLSKINSNDADAIKSLIVKENYVMLATSRGIKVLPTKFYLNGPEKILPKQWVKQILNDYNNIIKITEHAFFVKLGRCHDITYDTASNSIYAAFADGLFKITNTTIKPVLFNNGPIYSRSIKFHKGKLYVSTYNQTVLLLEGEQVKKVLKIDIPQAELKIIQDRLWLIGKHHLGFIDLSNLSQNKVELPNLLDGFFYDVAENNEGLLLATSEGIYKTNVRSKKIPVTVPNYLLYALVNQTDTFFNSGISLQYNANNIRFVLSSPSLLGENISFKHRLQGSYITNWSFGQLGDDNFNYAALSPGEYTFEAIALNVEGIAVSTPLFFSFRIAKPIWKRWWFFAIIAFASLLLFLYIFHISLVAAKSKKQFTIDKLTLEKELSNSKLAAIKSQLNPHFIFNSLNSIQSVVLTDDKKTASEYLVKLSELIRNVLNFSQKNYITLAEEIKTLNTYIQLELFRYNNSFTYSIDVDPQINTHQIKIPSMLLQPFVENAIKHGFLNKEKHNRINIFFNLHADKQFIEIIIDDNGIGRKKSIFLNRNNLMHKSFASHANENRIQLINKSLSKKIELVFDDKTDENNIASGTRVKLLVPFDEINRLAEST